MKIQNVFRTALIATLAVGVGLIIWNAAATLAAIITYIGAALFIAMGLEPAVRWVTTKGLPRWSALIIVLLGLIAVITGLIWIIMPVVVGQIAGLFESISKYAQSLTFEEFLNSIRDILGPLNDYIDLDTLQKQIIEFFQNTENLAGIGSGVLNVGLGIANGIFGAFIIFILTIYFTASLPNMKKSFVELVPASKREKVESLTDKITKSVGNYVAGQVSLAALSGVLSFIFLSILGAPFPAVLATIGFMFTLIPLIGTVTGSTIIVLTTLLLGNTTIGIIAAIYYYVFYMNIEAYVISPRIMNKAVAVPGSIVVIAALSGGALLGLLGALIAIPVAASVLIIIREVVVPKQDAS
ncbi:MAG: AI-2E family transporter [Microbacteriaceae bacterium]